MKSEPSIEELREQLARQILEIALSEDNAQFKLDSYRATQERGRGRPPETPAQPVGMEMFRERLRKAEVKANGTEPTASDC